MTGVQTCALPICNCTKSKNSALSKKETELRLISTELKSKYIRRREAFWMNGKLAQGERFHFTLSIGRVGKEIDLNVSDVSY